jgi:hypothetical protein
MHKILFLLLLGTAAWAADMPMNDFSDNRKIALQNSIVAKVNGNTISMMDVKKKMDLLFHQNYPNLSTSTQARFQFYQVSWRQILMDLIDHELIIADAEEKEVKLSDGEVREEMERRFGPNVMKTLDQIGLTYEETWQMVRNELLVQRMSWWFIQSKAMQNVTPQDLRIAYKQYLEQNPPYQEWAYRVISIRSDQPQEKLAEEIYQLLTASGKSPERLSDKLKEFETDSTSIQLSTEYVAADKDLSEVHKTALASLTPGTYSKPSFQTSRADKKTVHRIFYLMKKTDHAAPLFTDLSQKLREDLLQKAVVGESQVYLGKLRKHYGFDTAHIKEVVPDNLTPFSLE